MIELLSRSKLRGGRASGQFVASTLRELRTRIVVGTNLLEIDQWTAELITAAGALSCYLDYAPSFGRGPFGHVICTSVNDAVLHGLPHDYLLADGDLLTLDFAVSLQGVVADSAVSFIVGNAASPSDVQMIDSTERALAAGIAAARPGGTVGDISHAVGTVLSSDGYLINTQFGGHGVGSTMHQEPHIANMGQPGQGARLKRGMLLAIEPWVMADTSDLVVDPDGWTLRSKTGARTAHSEHTISVTDEGIEVLTA